MVSDTLELELWTVVNCANVISPLFPYDPCLVRSTHCALVSLTPLAPKILSFLFRWVSPRSVERTQIFTNWWNNVIYFTFEY